MVELKAPGYPPSKKMVAHRRVYVPLDDDTFDHLQEVAWRNQVSVNYIGSIAIMKLLTEEAKGEFSFMPGYMGKPLPRA